MAALTTTVEMDTAEAEMDEFDMFAARARCGGSSLALSRECKSQPGTPPTPSPAHLLGDHDTLGLGPRANGSVTDGSSPRKHRVGRPHHGDADRLQENGKGLQRSQSYRRPPRVHWEDKDQAPGHKWQRTRSVTVRKTPAPRPESQVKEAARRDSLQFTPDYEGLNRRRGSSIPEIDLAKFNENSPDCKIYRVRSFSTRHGGGIVNRGDSYKVRNRQPRAESFKRGSLFPGGDVVAPRSPYTPKHPPQLPGKCPTITVQDGDGGQATPVSISHERLSQSDPVAQPPPPDLTVTEDTGHVVPIGIDDIIPELSEGAAGRGSLMEEENEDGEGDEEDEDDDDDDEEESPDMGEVSKVLVLGAQGVGKTTLTQQLLTSEYLANSEDQDDNDDEVALTEKVVSVSLDDVESMVQFIDVPGFEANRNQECVDAHVIVYSVTDKNSFNYAQACLQDLKKIRERHDVVILVANKNDLVRNRMVSDDEGRNLAIKRKCKFIELSAMLDHRVDELLVGIIRQIRLKQQAKQEDEDVNNRSTGCLHRATFGLFRRLFRRQKYASRSCDSLLAP